MPFLQIKCMCTVNNVVKSTLPKNIYMCFICKKSLLDLFELFKFQLYYLPSYITTIDVKEFFN